MVENMTVWDKIVKLLLAAVGMIVGALGGASVALNVLLILMAVDYASGIMVGIMGKSHKTNGGGLDSKIGFIGLGKKGLMLTLVLVAAQLDRAIGGSGHVFRDAVCWFYIANEGLSFLENLALAGVPFPARIKQLLEQTKDKHDKPPDVEPAE